MNMKRTFWIFSLIVLLGMALGAQENLKVIGSLPNNPCLQPAQAAQPPVMTPEQLLLNLKNEQFTGEPYDFNFEDTNLSDAIRFLGRITGLRFAFSDSALGVKLTCELMQIPWDKALSIFLKSNRLWVYILTSNGVTYLFVDCR